MRDLDIQIFFDSLFEDYKNEKEIEKLYNKLIDNLEICKDEALEFINNFERKIENGN